MSQVQDHQFTPTDDGSHDRITLPDGSSYTTQTTMTAQERSADTYEAHKQFVAASGQFGPAAVDVNTTRKVVPVGPRQEGVIGAPRFHPSPSLDPKLIESLEGYEEFGEDLGAVRACFASATDGLNAINAAVVQLRADPTHTEAAAVVKVCAQAERKAQALYEMFGRNAEKINQTISTLERSLSTPVEQQAGLGTINDRIREHVSKLDATKRHKFMEEAFRKEDTKTLVAILGAPPYLSGLEDNAAALYLRRLHEMQQPETTRRLKALREASSLIERAFPIAMSSVEKALGSSFRKAKEMKATAEKSEAAIAAIMAPSL